MATNDEDVRPDGSTAAPMSRRSFVTKVAATSAGFAIVPRHVLGRGLTAPSDTLNVACVGRIIPVSRASPRAEFKLSQHVTVLFEKLAGLVERHLVHG